MTQPLGKGHTGAGRADADLIEKQAIAVMTLAAGVCQFSDNRGFFATEARPD